MLSFNYACYRKQKNTNFTEEWYYSETILCKSEGHLVEQSKECCWATPAELRLQILSQFFLSQQFFVRIAS